MKRYDNTMEHLRFRENFCEETILKAQQTKHQRRLPRGLVAAACVCLCSVVLFTTAWAVSPEFRSIFIQNEQVEAPETVALPNHSDTVIENSIGAIKARYYKLDGKLSAHEGLGSLLPVEKDGVMTFYAVTEDGSLQAATPIRAIDKTLEYQGSTFELRMDIYSGDVATAVVDDRVVPMTDENSFTIWHETKTDIFSPLFVDLTTWEIYDPMAKVEFTLPEGATDVGVSASKKTETLLLSCHMEDGSERIYYANAKSGEVVDLHNTEDEQWFMCAGEIYSYCDGTLSKLNEAYKMETLVENCNYIHAANYVYFAEGEALVIFDIANEKRYVIEQGSELFASNPYISANADGTKLKLANFGLGNGLDTNAIAIIDLQQGKMFSLERESKVREEMGGWFDNERFLIAGTIAGEWYACMYEIG